MHELHQKVEVLDYLETYIFNSFNSGKCLAMDGPQMSEGGGDYEKGRQERVPPPHLGP